MRKRLAPDRHGSCCGLVEWLSLHTRLITQNGGGICEYAGPQTIGFWRGQALSTLRNSAGNKDEIAVAARLEERQSSGGFPSPDAWSRAQPVCFDWDWQGKNANPKLKTEVRILWNQEALYLQFLAHYQAITVFGDSRADGWRDQLWERDVAEVFLQPAGEQARRYKEIEVSPNGMWIDLEIAPGEKRELKSRLRRLVNVDARKRMWIAQVALPMKALTPKFDPSEAWRVNFFRVEGEREPRFYSAWRPTGTPIPNFHVPERFGRLEFER